MPSRSPGKAAGGGGEREGERSRDVKLTLQEAAKKLALWHTATFRPILTHDDLEPILAVAGFVALPLPPPQPEDQEAGEGTGGGGAVPWREYAFLGGGGGGCRRNVSVGLLGPRPRLPYPRVDALHLRTYQAFLAAVEVHLGALRLPHLFHVRCMPVSSPHDRVFDKLFRPMRSDQDSIIVYRDGTLQDAGGGGAVALCSGRVPAMEDAGCHVIPGSTCRDRGCLRLGKLVDVKVGCGAESCRPYPNDIDVVRVKDLFPGRHHCRGFSRGGERP